MAKIVPVVRFLVSFCWQSSRALLATDEVRSKIVRSDISLASWTLETSFASNDMAPVAWSLEARRAVLGI